MTRLRNMFLAPAALLMLVTIAVPLEIICVYSVLSRGAYGGVELPWTFEELWSFDRPTVRQNLCAIIPAGGCGYGILHRNVGFPLALFIVRSGARKNLYLSLVILPFWTSFLIRLYAWMFLLRDTGLINTVLQSAGVIREPLPMLYNNGAVVLGLVYGFLPFAVLPLYATLEKLDQNLLDAAADLGARPLAVLLRVTLPLCAPGIGAAAILVFIPCLGTYLTSDLLGGSKTILIGNLVQNQFTTARDWPFGAALSIVLIMVAVLLLFTVRRRGEEFL